MCVCVCVRVFVCLCACVCVRFDYLRVCVCVDLCVYLCACACVWRFLFLACVARGGCVVSGREACAMLRFCSFAGLLVAVVVAMPPVVNVRLSPPKVQLPEVIAEIRSLDRARSSKEVAGLRRLDAAFEAAIQDADARIHGAVAAAIGARSKTSASLFGASSQRVRPRTGFLLHVSPASPVSNAVLKKVAAVERVRGMDEQLLVDQGVRELGLLVDIVTAGLQTSLRSHGAGFLDAGAAIVPAVDVRLLPPSEPFATVAGLVAEMEARRDGAEDNLRKHIIELELKLLQRMNEMLAAALG